ncbi:MAG: hypothetical protein RBU21_20285, partial [FCB group bacterium]|nr:hypothetical protein [FCB group bacterium]
NSFTHPSLYGFFTDLTIGFSSGNYRVQPFQKNAALSDSVPIAIDKAFVMPGVVNYTDGHCLLLADVDQYGELHFLNAGTADTRDIYTYNGMNVIVGIEPHKEGPVQTAYEGCYQGLRAYRFPIAITDARGRVTEVRRRTDEEMREFGFSLEQFDKMGEMYTGQKIVEKGIELQSFHSLIRYRLRSVDKVIPMQFMRDYIEDLVQMWHFRDTFVQNAWKDVLANGPIVYPERQPKENIFQANGRWETWSSPSSDVDRRNKYFYLADWMDDAIDWFDRMPQYVDLTGLEKYNIKNREDLAKALIAEKQKLFNEKTVHYTNSQGRPVPLTLAELERRLFDLSFDPNHPPELRWGAKPGSEEFKTATRTFPTPLPGGARMPMEESYRLQAYYRSVCQREQEVSYLREMFTEGYPLRTKFDEQLAKWYTWKTKPQVQEAVVVEEAPLPLVVSAYYEKRDAKALPTHAGTAPAERNPRARNRR